MSERSGKKKRKMKRSERKGSERKGSERRNGVKGETNMGMIVRAQSTVFGRLALLVRL